MNQVAPTQDLFIGVDEAPPRRSGAWRTPWGEALSRGQVGPANIRPSVEGSWRSIHEALNQALAQSGLPLDDPARFMKSWLGKPLASPAGALRVGRGARCGVDDPPSRSRPSFDADRYETRQTMATNNPYQAFVNGF